MKNLYLAEFHGHYMGGEALVLARTRGRAREIIVERLGKQLPKLSTEARCPPEDGGIHLTHIGSPRRQGTDRLPAMWQADDFFLIDNGDY